MRRRIPGNNFSKSARYLGGCVAQVFSFPSHLRAFVLKSLHAGRTVDFSASTLRRNATEDGRGAAENPPNRFEKIHLEPDADWNPDEDGQGGRPQGPRTQFFKDHSQTVIARNDSPDVGFSASLNPYRGCEHGCIYCYARPTHEYLGFSAGLDFESKIMVKEDAPELLRQELMSLEVAAAGHFHERRDGLLPAGGSAS